MVAATPAITRVRELAEEALKYPEGLTVFFTVESYGNLRNASYAARAFQTSFSAMRASARRRSVARDQRDRMTSDTEYKGGPYDSLACAKLPLDDSAGWKIMLVPSHALNFANDVIITHSGEQLNAFKPGVQRAINITLFWFKKADEANRAKVRFVNPLTPEDEAFLFAQDPVTANEIYAAMGVPTPQEREEASRGLSVLDAPGYKKDVFDLMDPEEDIFAEPDEEG